jgi:methionine-rich copper-binding protein CopC
MKALAIAACVVAAAGLNLRTASAQSKPVVLITAEESQLAAAPQGDLTFRAGVSRGPSITVVSPKPDDPALRSPFRLHLKFEGRGGAQVDADTLKLTYARSPAVDLTARVKQFANPSGIDVSEVSVPPGNHTIRAEVKDKDGRAGSVTFVIKMAR